jgi:HD superfamily phosphohydrolase
MYLVFPGAVHSRFEHSVGVAYLAGVVHDRLREGLPARGLDKKLMLNEITRASLQVSALLHDIGHGPFCHLFEMFCRRNPEFQDWDHEEFGLKLLRGEGSLPIFQQIPTSLSRLADSLQKEFPDSSPLLGLLKPQNVFNIAMGTAPDLGDPDINSQYQFLKDVIPSAFGVDRLDYLRRDAYYTGINTGNIDIWEIISNLSLHEYKGSIGLYLNPSVSVGLEALLAARSAVYRRVYHNPIHRSAQELIVRALAALGRHPEDLVLLTDDELLNMFLRSGDDFLIETYQRVKFRLLYEVLELVAHTDLTSYKSRLSRVKASGPDMEKKENHIASQAKLARNHRVFYDLELVPAIKLEDFESKIFFDRVKGEPLSLFDLQPALADLYRGSAAGDIKRAEAYRDAVSRIYVSFPFEHISSDIEAVSSNDPTHWPQLANKIYMEKLSPLVSGFFDQILEVNRPNEFNEHKEAIRHRAVAYLLDLISLTAET